MSTITGSGYLDGLGATKPSTQSNGTLGQDAFLKLLTTQLKTQDPFDPVDNTQMVAQMAQFSSVAGISEMNQSLKALAANLTGTRIGDVANWIGRGALVNSNVVAPLRDGSYAGEITLAKDAAAVNVSLVDENGAVVHSENLGAQTAGEIAFAWDGKNAAGETISSGPLKVVVTAGNADGFVDSTVATWTQVVAVQSPAGGSGAKLMTALGLISPEDALRLG